MRTSEFEYLLPPELIAQTPAEPRDASRLMVVRRDQPEGTKAEIQHSVFHQIGDWLHPGDLLVLNKTRVIPARLFGQKVGTGGRVEILLLKRHDNRTWETLVRGKGLRPGIVVEMRAGASDDQQSITAGGAWASLETGRDTDGAHLRAEIVDETEAGGRLVRFEKPVEPLLDALGVLPLPPYIHAPLSDPERYQTVYGQVEGSVAASTAGLHFTPDLLLALRQMGIEIAWVTLHIGLDTFRPVKEERVEAHQIHTEWYELTAPEAERINRARLEGRRVIAVGTTAVRALESAAGGAGLAPGEGRRESPGAAACQPSESNGPSCPWRSVSAYAGPTDLYIYPGYRFRVVDAMVTNFHLPRSTLLMLVSAFSGREVIAEAYQQAIRDGYRFYSFGDAMLLL